MKEISLRINGESKRLRVKPNSTLLAVLRNELGMMGVKEGCGLGECGACVVLMNNRPVNSCLLLAVEAEGKEITTIEGLSLAGLDPLQEAFIEHGAVQCGFCTPGMILTAKGLLNRNPSPDEDVIREALAGNLCRCTGYVRIVSAIQGVVSKGKRKSGCQ